MDADAYRILFDANPLPIYVADRETMRILPVNRAACELYGWSRDEFLALTIRDIRPPAEMAQFEASFAAAKEGATYSRQGKHRTKDGRILDVTLEISSGFMLGDRPASLAVITDVTGIAQAERRFRLLVEHSDGIALTNAEGIVEYVSPGGRRALGYPEEEIVGHPLYLTISHPDDVTTEIAPGETQNRVARFRHHDGSWRWFESSTTNLTHDPAVRAYVTNFRDITERKLAEQLLVQQQQRLEFLLSATSAVTYTARLAGERGATFISNNVAKVLGHEPAAFYAGATFWRDNIHPDDRGRIDAEIADALPSQDSITLQYRFRHRDGSYRWMRDVSRVIRDANGQPLEIVGYWIDVTDQVRAEESVRRSEANFRTLIERAPTATFVHRGGCFVYVNPAAVAMLGLDSADKIVGRSVLDFVHPDDREPIRQRMGELTETGRVSPSSGRMLRANGSVFVMEGEAMRLDFDGEASNVVMGVDATERHEMLARMALADRMLSVGTLAAGVAHEINNPLAYIATNLEVLAAELPHIQPTRRSRLTESTLHGLVTDARDGVARVSAIVRDLRSLARPDDKGHGPVDVAGVLRSSIKLVNNEVRHRAAIVQTYADSLPLVEGEASRLGQVFINMLLNAAQSIPEGHADRNEIRIGAAPNADRTCVRISIADTGCGMSQTVIRRIFDPFFTTKAPGSGMGLGLAISHQIVSSMKGQIDVTSKLGEGTTFTVSLPVTADQEVSAQTSAPQSRKVTSRILLIDDEPAVGRSLGMLLAPETEVIAEIRAEDALSRLAGGERFDAIVCDLMMPEISGIELYDRLTHIAPDCTGQIIFMTGGAFTPQAREFLAKLERPHLEKPFSEAQFRRAIESGAAADVMNTV